MISQHILKMTSSITIATLLLTGHAQAATKSISAEVFNEINGQSFWQATVECEEKTEKQIIQSSVESEQWCFSAQPETCFNTKLVAAKKICAADLSVNTSQQPTVSTSEVTANPSGTDESDNDGDSIYNYVELRAEKAQLEEQRLNIQQEKLSLRRREIELQKRELELNN